MSDKKLHGKLPKPIEIKIRKAPDDCSCGSELAEWSDEYEWYVCPTCGGLVPEDELIGDDE